MASGGDIHSILYRGDALKQAVPRYNPAKKVQRYFPGQVPKFGGAESDGSYSSDSEGDAKWPESVAPSVQERRLELLNKIEKDLLDQKTSDDGPDEAQPVAKRRRRRIQEPVVVVHHDLPLPESSASVAPAEKPEQAAEQIHAPELVGSAPLAVDEESLRDQRRQRILQLRKEEEKQLEAKLSSDFLLPHMQEFPGSSEESEEDDDEDDDDQEARPLYIPVSKRQLEKQMDQEQQRHTIRAQADEELKQQERVQESKRLLAETIQSELEDERRKLEKATVDGFSPEEMPDDNDDENQELEYELWRVRELQRMVRDEREVLERQKEQERIERRRLMTADELEKDNARLDALQPKAESRKKYLFLQKYYHKGAFFQDLGTSGTEPLYLRDFNEPLAEDKIDKGNLPKPLQTRRGLYGKAGQVKHTHLTDVDTSDFTYSWGRKNNPIQRKLTSKLAGYKGASDLDRPSARKKQ